MMHRDPERTGGRITDKEPQDLKQDTGDTDEE
jgi:hypothetical protein